jgi:sporulation protein YlmC with PRC-barrel domain
MLDLVRDVLDKQLLGNDEERMGKVDGIVLSLREGQPPRVTFLETGPQVLARRVSRWLGERIEQLESRWGIRQAPMRIPWEKVRTTGKDVEVEVDAKKSNAFAWERWLRDNVVLKMPGTKG